MASVIALFIIILAAYLVVLVGSIAFELTGLDRDTSRFQALSAFTNCGFTTRASEKIVEHPLRRRIAMILIITGYGGLASFVATLLRSVDVEGLGAQARNLAFLAIALTGLVWLIQRQGVQIGVTDWIRRHLMPRLTAERVPHEDVFRYREGYGVTRVELPRRSRVAGLKLRETDLRGQGLQVLAIEEEGIVEPIPDPDRLLVPGQHLIVYGRLSAVQSAFEPRD